MLEVETEKTGHSNTLTVTDMLFIPIWHSEFSSILFRHITFQKKKWRRTTFSKSAVKRTEILSITRHHHKNRLISDLGSTAP